MIRMSQGQFSLKRFRHVIITSSYCRDTVFKARVIKLFPNKILKNYIYLLQIYSKFQRQLHPLFMLLDVLLSMIIFEKYYG